MKNYIAYSFFDEIEKKEILSRRKLGFISLDEHLKAFIIVYRLKKILCFLYIVWSIFSILVLLLH